MDDEARQGALRFAEREGGPFVREEGVTRIPPMIELAGSPLDNTTTYG